MARILAGMFAYQFSNCTYGCSLVLFAAVGCSSPLFSRHPQAPLQVEPTVQQNNAEQQIEIPTAKASPQSNGTTDSREEAMARVLVELDEIRELDPEAQKRLLANLRLHKSGEWPLMVSQFHSALKYQQELKNVSTNSKDTIGLKDHENSENHEKVATSDPGDAL